jgi:hypothetical protein
MAGAQNEEKHGISMLYDTSFSELFPSFTALWSLIERT